MNLLRTSSKSITRVSQFASLTRRLEYRLFSTEAPAAQFQHQHQIPLPSPLPTPSTTTQPPPHHDTTTTQHNHRTSTLHNYSPIAPPHPPPAANFYPFHGSLPGGAFIVRLTGITKHTSKSDILNLLSDPALSFEDIKHDYSLSFLSSTTTVSVRNDFQSFIMSLLELRLVRFPSRQAYEVGLKSLTKKGRYRLEKERDANKWDAIQPFDGKYVLLHEIPRNALPEDISRLLSGCHHDASSIQIFTSPKRMAIVGFPSQELAMHAFITKNRKPCLSQEMKMQVLY